jgi:hypothetical protein
MNLKENKLKNKKIFSLNSSYIRSIEDNIQELNRIQNLKKSIKEFENNILVDFNKKFGSIVKDTKTFDRYFKIKVNIENYEVDVDCMRSPSCNPFWDDIDDECYLSFAIPLNKLYEVMEKGKQELKKYKFESKGE